ncbi:hypothetical protein [Victivallis sp. Marseille-Q1083]|nr:hypothetical protein [Victivallis sp. Marseille-Q1083]
MFESKFFTGMIVATLVVLGVILALQCVEMQQYDLFNETFGSVK